MKCDENLSWYLEDVTEVVTLWTCFSPHSLPATVLCVGSCWRFHCAGFGALSVLAVKVRAVSLRSHFPSPTLWRHDNFDEVWASKLLNICHAVALRSTSCPALHHLNPLSWLFLKACLTMCNDDLQQHQNILLSWHYDEITKVWSRCFLRPFLSDYYTTMNSNIHFLFELGNVYNVSEWEYFGK